MQHAVGVGIQHRIGFELFVRRQADDAALTRRHFELALALQCGQVGVGLKVQDLGVLRIGHGLRLIFALTRLPLRFGLFADHQIRVDVRLYTARRVDVGGVDFIPTLRRLATHKRCATHVGDLLHRLFGRQAMGDFNNSALGVAIEQQIAFAVNHDGAAHFVRPIIVMRDAAQRAFNAAQNNGHVVVGLFAALAVDQCGAVGTFAADVAGGVGVVAANFAISRVTVDHGIHVARGHAEEQIGFAQGFEGFGALPIGLGNDADPKTLVLQHPPNDGHAKTGVIDIGVARDDDDVATVPTELRHFLFGHRQKRSCAETSRPVFSVTGERLGVAGEQRHVCVIRHNPQV